MRQRWNEARDHGSGGMERRCTSLIYSEADALQCNGCYRHLTVASCDVRVWRQDDMSVVEAQLENVRQQMTVSR